MGVLRVVLAGVLVVALAAPAGLAQPSPPLTATLILKNPPVNVTYNQQTPVAIVLQLKNTSGAPVNTTEGFSQTEFWRRLFFTDPQGGTIINTAEAGVHADRRVFHCLSRGRVLLRPTALPVVPIEVLAAGAPPAGFFLEYTIDDARRFYDLSRPGRYTVNARVPLQTFQSDSSAIITDCDQLEGQTLVNVGAVTGRQAFTIVSNTLEFVIASTFRFSGFLRPLIDDSQCSNPVLSPCQTFKLGRTLPVKFQILDANNQPVSTATVRIAVARVDGLMASLDEDLFRYDPTSGQYIYNLHTRGLTRGVWRIDAAVDLDGSVHSTHVSLR
jgi:hypothetical protein